MNKIVFLFLFITPIATSQKLSSSYSTRLGKVTISSCTVAEDIEAINNQAFCVLNPETGDIALDILMRAFVFENTLMYDHFNESYVESDLYPKAVFRGEIIDFDLTQSDTQIRMIEGFLTLKDQTVPLAFKVEIDNTPTSYVLSGTTVVLLEDYSIKIPKLLTSNISNSIHVSFRFECKVSNM
ncbi:YceI family protein [Dokdonia ponticola]|uniref:YceI family protein n=1 Tax=Dokdonia ponticola TaxID=2041041 RepID=A0ABV9HZA9_9FLAO